MPIEILMPALSPTMKDGTLAKWLKAEGDHIEPGMVIAEIETDKATMEVEAVDEGKLGKIFVKEGAQNVLVNQLIAVLLEEGESEDDIKDYGSAVSSQKSSCTNDKKQDSSAHEVSDTKDTQPFSENLNESRVSNDNARIFASPLAKRIAADKGIDLSQVKGTGPKGRIVKEDVLNYKDNGSAFSTSASIQAGLNRNPEEFKRLPVSTMRSVIAARLLESKQNIPHFYLNIECKIDNLLKIRAEMNAMASKDASDKPSYKLSVNDFIIKASAMALRDVPEANSSWDSDSIIVYNNIDIAVAVAIDGGLITPIIRNADIKNLGVISSEMKSLAKRAKANQLGPHEFQGGGFSISNLGMYGIKSFNAIINPPQSCILSVGASQEKLIIGEGGQVMSVNIIEMNLSCDHRVVDGAVGANFFAALKKYIEQPYLMLL